jgi:predicted transcriptional regulator
MFLLSSSPCIWRLSGDEAPAAEPVPEVVAYEPAVPVRSSIKPDYLVSLIDGRKYKTLKRHLATNGLTPDEYRVRYGLKPDYPMVAANFAAMRREIAEKIGLGRKSAARLDDTDGTVAAPAETQEAALPATEEDRFERDGKERCPQVKGKNGQASCCLDHDLADAYRGETCRRDQG